MTSRERIASIVRGQNLDQLDRTGFWLGNPHPHTWPQLHQYFGTDSEESLRQALHDDVRWVSPQFFADHYQDPQGRAPFDMSAGEHERSCPLAGCETVADVDRFPWPDAQYVQVDSCLQALDQLGDVYRLSGFWTCFYHNVMDLFGMQQYMINMHLNPDVVHAVTDRVCQFYYEANEKFFEQAGDRVDAFFFGNDFGTQLDLICGPEQFDQFIMPWFRTFTEQAHRHGYRVVLHSCGAIYKVIDRLIEANVDCLHPLQARASNMDAQTLARDFKGRIAFMGAVDTQELLVNASVQQVREEVRRLKDLLGPALVISPSHEAILPNIPPANIEAMAEEAHKG